MPGGDKKAAAEFVEAGGGAPAAGLVCADAAVAGCMGWAPGCCGVWGSCNGVGRAEEEPWLL